MNERKVSMIIYYSRQCKMAITIIDHCCTAVNTWQSSTWHAIYIACKHMSDTHSNLINMQPVTLRALSWRRLNQVGSLNKLILIFRLTIAAFGSLYSMGDLYTIFSCHFASLRYFQVTNHNTTAGKLMTVYVELPWKGLCVDCCTSSETLVYLTLFAACRNLTSRHATTRFCWLVAYIPFSVPPTLHSVHRTPLLKFWSPQRTRAGYFNLQ